MKRASLTVASILALPVGAVWWVGTGLLSGSDESACVDSLAADLTFVAANAGLVLALCALGMSIAGNPLNVATWLLVAYLVLLGASAFVFLTC